MESLKMSIALMAHNRESYVGAQLDSILSQRRPPDEVIIGDDCSSDRTAEIIKSFAAAAPFPVRWYVNEANEGYNRNLQHGLDLCSGDVIVLCDDDDICLPERLLQIEYEFLKSEDVGLVVSNSELVDQNLHRLGTTLWDAHKFTSRELKAISGNPITTLAKHFIAYGHVVSFRASLRPCILGSIPDFPPRVFFDVWLALVATTITNIACIPNSLVLHRLHSDQIGGVATLISRTERIKEVQNGEQRKLAAFECFLRQVIDRVARHVETPISQRKLQSLIAWADHLKMQSALSNDRGNRVLPIARALFAGRYHQYSRGLLTAVRDLLIL
jgi:glycosyltransferase involved in cell wall biosynthesis